MFRLDSAPWHDAATSGSIAMPLGGIGTGTVALCGDGSLRQWQLANVGAHTAFLPDSFFAIRAARPGKPDLFRSLEATPAEDPAAAPLTNDASIPAELRRRHRVLPPLAEARFRAVYPAAEVEFLDPELPIGVSLIAYTPFVPLDTDASSIPGMVVEFTLSNPSDGVRTGWLGASLQNAVGWDAVTPISGVRGAGYGGNWNRFRSGALWSGLVLGNADLASDAPSAGQLVLASDAPGVNALEQYDGEDEFAGFLRGRYLLDQHLDVATPQRVAGQGAFGGAAGTRRASAAGSTWNGALAVPYRLGAGEERTIRFFLTWSFPNRYVNFTQFGERRDYGKSALWLGNHYATLHADAVTTADLLARELPRLERETGAWIDTLGSLDPVAAEHLAAQASLIRSTTNFRTEDGAFYGFEGVQGASTGGWADNGGSCPLNCTHVWNYEQALSRLFPDLERSMRDTEFDVLQAPDGHLPHRVVVPTFVRQLWGEPIGGPIEPALDGMLGTFLKCLREVQQGTPVEWLERRWPALLRLFTHIRDGWDSEGTGTLTGVQPSTFDIPLAGLNPYIGSYWLAALLALERMAGLVADADTAREARDLFDRGSAAYDDALWTGKYYRQELAEGETGEYSWGEGCLADQLVGQWWAHQLGLGHILPAEHVRTALASIVRYNFRESFADFEHDQRIYADGDDAGLLNCSWPQGGRPEFPVWYCDEVWTGVEYQVAASCFFEGLVEEGQRILDALWARYDGTRRNPFNEIECGDHYARAMAGFSVLEARSGMRYDASTRTIVIASSAPTTRTPFFNGSGWGVVDHDAESGALTLELVGGALIVDQVIGLAGVELASPVEVTPRSPLRLAAQTEGDAGR